MRRTLFAPLLLLAASLLWTGSAGAEEETTAAAVMSRFLQSCLSQLHDPNAAIDRALNDPALLPAADGTADEILSIGDGIAWVDGSSVPGVVLAIATNTYHCAAVSDNVRAGDAFAQFAALILELEKSQGMEAELHENPANSASGERTIQSFAVFRRPDGNITTIDLLRLADPEERGLVRLAATITLP